MELNSNIFKIEYNKVAPKKGRVLISEPFLQDTCFKRSIVLLTEHTNEGSVGNSSGVSAGCTTVNGQCQLTFTSQNPKYWKTKYNCPCINFKKGLLIALNS